MLQHAAGAQPEVVVLVRHLGGGLVGCEFANDLVAAGHEVDVVDLAPRPLARFWPEPMADMFRGRLEAAGVRWHLGRRIERIDFAPKGLLAKLDDGRVLVTGAGSGIGAACAAESLGS